jgi:hypothetical protein
MTLLSPDTQKSKSSSGCWTSPNMLWVSSEYWGVSDNIFIEIFLLQTIPESRDGLHLAPPRFGQLKDFHHSILAFYRSSDICHVSVYFGTSSSDIQNIPCRHLCLGEMPKYEMINEMMSKSSTWSETPEQQQKSLFRLASRAVELPSFKIQLLAQWIMIGTKCSEKENWMFRFVKQS